MPTFASTGRAQLAYIKESVYGTTPGAGNGRFLRITGESLNYDVSKQESEEIRSDRQNVGATTVDAGVSGGFNFKVQYAEYDQLLEGVMQQLYTVFGVQGVSSAVSTVTFAAGSLTASVATSGVNDWSLLQKGQWFRANAPGNAANDGKYYRVSTTVAPTTTVITLDASTPAIAAATIPNCTIATSRISNGTTMMSFSVEKQLTDVAQFFTYRGCGVNKMSLNFQAGSTADGSFDLMGKDAVRNVATQLPGTTTASNIYEIQNGVKGIGQLWENGVPITSTSIKSMTMEINNDLRGQKALGTLGNIGLGTGDFDCTGTLEAYFADGTQYDRFLTDTYTSLVVGIRDTANNGYVFSMPRVLLMSSKVVAGAKNQDIMATFEYKAFADLANATAALQKTLFIDRLGVAAP